MWELWETCRETRYFCYATYFSYDKIKKEVNVMKDIKCPVCGNTRFVRIERPYNVWGDAYIKDDERDFFGCTQCGLVLTFAYAAVKKVLDKEAKDKAAEDRKKEILKNNKLLEQQILKLEEEKQALEKEKEDPNRTVKRDEELKNEISKKVSKIESLKRKIQIV